MKNVQFYHYMRGLDGKLPDKGDKAGGVAAKNTDSKGKTDAEALIEFPEGQSQKDYLRRLTHQVLELDQRLKKSQSDRKGIVAIGVLGSDVHDKLMILEALRQHFPHKLFFTTDLDVVYNHPDKWPQSHNLLVASAFDLQLRDELQGHIPPFRDSYQTAFFLATQVILSKEISTKAHESKFFPRMFEIGRSRPVPLRTCTDFIKTQNDTSEDKCRSEDDEWRNSKNPVQPEIFTTFQNKVIIPPFERNWESVKAMGARVITILAFVFVLPWVSWRCRDYIRMKMRGIVLTWKSHSYKVLLPVGFVLLGFVVVLAFMQLQRVEKYFTEYDAEPFYWFQGVSAWPSILLRFLAGAIAIGAFFWGRNRIKKMQSDLQTHHDVNDEKILGFNLPEKGSERNTFLDGLFVWNFSIEEFEKQESGNKRNVLLDSLWKKYLDYWNQKKLVKASTWRAIFHGTVFIIVILPFIYWFDFPNAPMRGDTAFIGHKLSLFCAVIPTVFLIRWVVENARLCERLIEILSAKPSSWNKNALQWARHKNVAPGCEEEWLDIELVTHLTKTIQPLIYGPMVCIGLLAMARSSLIDDWDLPLWLILVFVAMLLFTFTTEVSLQRGARVSRAKAIKHMTEKIRLQRNSRRPNETIITRIEVEIERIRALREGAFCPWYEWPWVQSFGGLGALIAALKYIPVLMLGGALVE